MTDAVGVTNINWPEIKSENENGKEGITNKIY